MRLTLVFNGTNDLQLVRVWLVALVRTKLVNKNEPEENPLGFSEYTQNKQLIIHIVRHCAYFFRGLIPYS